MNKLFKTLSFVATIAFFATACTPPVVEVAKAAPAEVSYQAVLGKLLSDQTVAEFIASNNCTQAGPFHLCRPAGVAFGSNEDNVVKTAYLYVSEAEGFSAYKGDLPMTLEASDTMADVERKMAQIRVPRVLKGGFDLGLPDESRSPDHTHYWAIYKRFGVTVIYNTPSANKNATIYAILVE
ncbi:MAG: hypothetical protein EHM33_21710 [Chloroflexi bacterium]|nr:MAG: hypothetical protein EHM33_21710 [Chloroflexota bacterium]